MDEEQRRNMEKPWSVVNTKCDGSGQIARNCRLNNITNNIQSEGTPPLTHRRMASSLHVILAIRLITPRFDVSSNGHTLSEGKLSRLRNGHKHTNMGIAYTLTSRSDWPGHRYCLSGIAIDGTIYSYLF